MKVLVTGGAGYIGTHTSVLLLEKGHEVVIVDNLCNSKEEAVKRVKEITGKELDFYKIDVCDENALREVFKEHKIDAVIHFAGLKAVGESVKIPLRYYDNNLTSTFALVNIMNEFDVKNIIFSSSATVYGDPKTVPITEDFPLSTTNPYGTTKLFIERILTDIAYTDKKFNPILLRYFNPVGAHESGMLGEDPKGIPNNVVPYITQVIAGKLPCLNIFGNDYDTKDGTGVRDYIHVVDLANGHVMALEKFKEENCGLKVYNLGTGVGTSVLDLVKAFEKALGKEVPHKFADRRAGDIAMCYADSKKAQEELGWVATKNLDDMCKDSLNWQQKNPNGME